MIKTIDNLLENATISDVENKTETNIKSDTEKRLKAIKNYALKQKQEKEASINKVNSFVPRITDLLTVVNQYRKLEVDKEGMTCVVFEKNNEIIVAEFLKDTKENSEYVGIGVWKGMGTVVDEKDIFLFVLDEKHSYISDVGKTNVPYYPGREKEPNIDAINLFLDNYDDFERDIYRRIDSVIG